MPKTRKIKKERNENHEVNNNHNNEDVLSNRSNNNELASAIILMSPAGGEGLEFVGEQTFDFNHMQQIKECKDMRHRAKENFLKECRSHLITKENCSKEKYQLFQIMEKTDDLTRPEENASIRSKLDRLDIKNMLKTLNQLEKEKKKQEDQEAKN